MAFTDTLNQSLASVITPIKNAWNNFNLKQLSEKIGGSSAEAVQAALHFGVAFGVGFFFKRYFKFLFGCLIVSLIFTKVLEYNNLLHVDWAGIKTLLSMQQGTDFNTFINMQLAWIRAHILLFISSVIGFLIGYFLG